MPHYGCGFAKMLKAIIFDCDGVIVDSEPNHLKAFQSVLNDIGISLSKEEYDKTYLAMDDKGCFETVLAVHSRLADKATVKKLIHQKMAIYQAFSKKKLHLYTGVVDFVKSVQGRYKLAIASGAFRCEIKMALDQGGIRAAFPVIVSAQDVKQCKPHPEPFLTALAQLNSRSRLLQPAAVIPIDLIMPHECVVIEDAIHGVMAARAAGMKTVAVTNSYPREPLLGLADHVVDSLIELTPETMENLCKMN